jgi:PAT family beta-lactamase induction signal transducer AmpG
MNASAHNAKPANPFLFFIFFIPFGIFSGYLTVTLGFLFIKSGLSVQQFAALAGMNLVPQIFKFIWAPVVDSTLTLKKWYLFATLVTASCIFSTGIIPIDAKHIEAYTIMVLVCSFARSFISAAIGGMGAHCTSPTLKGKVGGYSQAGNLGGGALGGGLGLLLAQHSGNALVPAGILALCCVLCCLALFYITEPVSTVKVKSIGKTVGNVYKDVWQTLKTNRGFLALLLNLVPLGTGAAGFLFAAVAKDWHAGAGIVEFVTGFWSGIVIIMGCIVGGFICDLVDRQKAFVWFSLLQGACCVGMAFCPHVPLTYIIWTVTYALANGFVNAGYGSFTLEAVDRGAAASKFELYSSMAYLPLYFMFWILGVTYSKWGAFGMLNTEAAIAVIAASVYFVAKAVIKNRLPISNNANPVYTETV